MNKDMFEGKWKQIRSQTQGWWGLFSDHDLEKVDKVPVKFDKYVTMLQVKYGYTRDQAKKEITRHVAQYEAGQKFAAASAIVVDPDAVAVVVAVPKRGKAKVK
jgi:uncharacterized protein YjbJ (UPF0337 family)